jgi:hypothetical protein
MPVFIVAYDLNRPGQQHDRLAEQLSRFPHCHAQQSVWFIEALGPASALASALSQFIDTNDKLFVDQVTGTWAGFNMPVCGKWLNDRGL